ncbi:MAG: InlB B-repeat-containing protein [Treponema sp.]
MKNIKGFSERFAAFFLAAAGFVLASCSNLSINTEEKNMSVKDGYAAISLAVGLRGFESESNSSESNARTVMPKADANNSASGFTDICLYAKLSSSSAMLGTSDTLLVKWENYNEMQIKPYSNPITAGTYDFMLTAKNYGATMTQTLTGKTLASGSTTKLNFTSLSADSNGAQTGSIRLNLYYNPYNYQVAEDFKKYVGYSGSSYFALSVSLDSKLIVTKDSSIGGLESTTDENGNTYKIHMYEASFTSAPVNAGFHIVSFTFTAVDGSVFVYPIPVHVEAGYLSKEDFYPFLDISSATQNSGTQSYTVNYNSNTTSAAVKTQTFYPGSSIADAEALGFTSADGKRFKEWNTQANGSGTAYKSGDTPALTGNLTLYAQWANLKKVTYIINIESGAHPPSMRNDFYVQNYETGDSLVTHTAAFSDFTSSTDAGKYTFGGWDTAENGSGTRYAAGVNPVFTEDTILYAQWCGTKKTSGPYSGFYSVKNVKQWNALMGAPFANTVTGTITANIVFEGSYNNTISNPVLSLTTGKTFNGKIVSTHSTTISGFSGVLFDKIAAGSEIDGININGPVCNTNEGTLKNVTVSGVQMSGYAPIAKINAAGGVIDSCTVWNCTVKGIKPASGESFVGGICNENSGEIKNCEVSSCTIDGETNGMQFTGGICGKNSGTISGDSTKVTGNVKGSTSAGAYEAVYTGGYCGYNSGNILGKGKVDITLSGCNNEKGHKGYVTGKNETNAVNEDSTDNKVTSEIKVIGLENGEVIINLENKDLGSGSTWTSDTFSLEENTKVYFLLQDSSGGSKTNKETLKLLTSDGNLVRFFVSSGTPNIATSIYLNKGTYKLSRHNGNGLYTSKMDIKIVRY